MRNAIKNIMKILSIETSCDDTGITLMKARGGTKNPSFEVLADGLVTQKIHAQYGGVYPMIAKREHIKNLPILLEKILPPPRQRLGGGLGGFQRKQVDVLAVTSGPGLEPCLWTGITLAQELGEKWSVPVVPVNHMEGHILSVFGNKKGKFKIPKVVFPVLALLVSGGHTELVLIKDWGKYKIIGKTLDDAAGEAFDKVARMLGLPYPGGPHISKLAEKERGKEKQDSEGVRSTTGARLQQFSSKKIAYPEKLGFSLTLPRPILHSKNFDFSFSGLKTAVLYLIKKIGPLDQKKKSQIAMEFENAVVETLVYKTKKAVEKHKTKTVIMAGGVAVNKHLRKKMKKSLGKENRLLFPTKELARDNAIMIGMAGYLRYLKKKIGVKNTIKIKAEGKLQLSR